MDQDNAHWGSYMEIVGQNSKLKFANFKKNCIPLETLHFSTHNPIFSFSNIRLAFRDWRFKVQQFKFSNKKIKFVRMGLGLKKIFNPLKKLPNFDAKLINSMFKINSWKYNYKKFFLVAFIGGFIVHYFCNIESIWIKGKKVKIFKGLQACRFHRLISNNYTTAIKKKTLPPQSPLDAVAL